MSFAAFSPLKSCEIWDFLNTFFENVNLQLLIWIHLFSILHTQHYKKSIRRGALKITNRPRAGNVCDGNEKEDTPTPYQVPVISVQESGCKEPAVSDHVTSIWDPSGTSDRSSTIHPTKITLIRVSLKKVRQWLLITTAFCFCIIVTLT